MLTAIIAVALVVATFIAYRPVWRAGFIWDDDAHLTTNPVMSAPHGLRLIWSSLANARYYPLTLTTFWVEHRLWGLDPRPYHLVNVALHALGGVLVFLLLMRLRVPAAGLAAAVWVLHPVNVESVAWITELKNTQSGVFFFLAVLCFLRFKAGGRRRWLLFSYLCGAGAMLSKASTVVLPAVLLACLWWQRGRWQRRDFVRLAPFFGMAVLMSLLTIAEQQTHIAKAGVADWTLTAPQRIVLAGQTIGFYAAKVLWPNPLIFVYPRWEINPGAIFSWLPVIMLISSGCVFWKLRQQSWARAALFGLGCFILGLLPVLGFFDVYYFRYSFVADHFQYLPSVGLIALATGAAAQVGERVPRSVGLATGAAVLLALGALTWRQAGVYQNSEAVWLDTLAKNPDCWMAENNMGDLWFKRGELPKAIASYERALRINPTQAVISYNLANALSQTGRLPEAVEHYRQALKIQPQFAQAHSNFGQTLQQMGKIKEAIQEYQAALQIEPTLVSTRNNLGNALFQAGHLAEAIEQYEATVRLQPDYAETHTNLATAYYQMGNAEVQAGRTEAAIQHYEHALQYDPGLSAAHYSLGNLLFQRGAWDGAIAHYREALKLDTRDVEVWSNLGLALIKVGRPAQAVRCYEEATRLKPDYQQAQNNLARLLAMLPQSEGGDPTRAITLAQHVCNQTGSQELAYEDTLAIAYAAAGRFSEAIAAGARAVELARAKQPQSVHELEVRLKLYRNRRAFRQLPAAPDSTSH